MSRHFPAPGHVDFIADQYGRPRPQHLVFPEVLQNRLGRLETVLVHHREDHQERVCGLGRPVVFDLKREMKIGALRITSLETARVGWGGSSLGFRKPKRLLIINSRDRPRSFSVARPAETMLHVRVNRIAGRRKNDYRRHECRNIFYAIRKRFYNRRKLRACTIQCTP